MLHTVTRVHCSVEELKSCWRIEVGVTPTSILQQNNGHKVIALVLYNH